MKLLRFRSLWYTVAFVVLLFFGIAMRAPEIIAHNYLFGFDQGRDYLAAYNIVEHKKLTLIGAEVGAGSAGLGGLFHGPGYFYLLALMYQLFSSDPYGGLVLMFFFGVGTLFLTFVTTRRMFGEPTALLCLFLVGISPLIAPQSRFLWNHHPSSFFIVLYLYFIFRSSNRPMVYIPLAVFTAGIIYHFELAIAVPLVLSTFLACICIYVIFDFRIYVLSAIAAVAAFFPMILFDMRHGCMAARGLISYLGHGAVKPEEQFGAILHQHINGFLSNARDSFVFEFGFIKPEHYMTVLFLVGILAVYVLYSTKDKKVNVFFKAGGLVIVVSFGLFMLLKNSVWNYYLIHLHFIYMYLFAYTFVVVIKKIRQSFLFLLPAAFLVFFLLSMTKGAVERLLINYRIDLPDYGGREKILGKRAVIDYIYQDAKNEAFNVFVFVPPVYTYPYDYLLLTYGKKKYGFVPGHEKKGLGYLIIEQDWYKPSSYIGWLETVIIDGKVIETKTLPSGHMLQKRRFSH